MSNENQNEEAQSAPGAPEGPGFFDRIKGFLGFFGKAVDETSDHLDQVFATAGEAVQKYEETRQKVESLEANLQDTEAALEGAATRHTAEDPRIRQIRAILNEKIADNSKVSKIRQLVG